jgi:flavodoxin
MKKIILLILTVCLTFSLVACGSTAQKASGNSGETTQQAEQQTDNTEQSVSSQSNAEETAAPQSDVDSREDQAGKSVLVAYFAYSENMGDTSGMDVDAITSASLNRHTDNEFGNLQVMAQEAATVKDGDLFSIRVTDPYDPDYGTMVGIAQDDQRNGKQFTFVDEIENFDNYEVIYIGVPVWWSKLPQPMVSFFEEYDFSGKTIIPFGIHLGSRFGSMIDQMKELEPNATILDGFTISADTDNDKVRAEFDAFLETVD